ncbi:hypothetical protein ACTXT7_006466 [Hymenolepis weldensis]
MSNVEKNRAEQSRGVVRRARVVILLLSLSNQNTQYCLTSLLTYYSPLTKPISRLGSYSPKTIEAQKYHGNEL